MLLYRYPSDPKAFRVHAQNSRRLLRGGDDEIPEIPNPGPGPDLPPAGDPSPAGDEDLPPERVGSVMLSPAPRPEPPIEPPPRRRRVPPVEDPPARNDPDGDDSPEKRPPIGDPPDDDTIRLNATLVPSEPERVGATVN